MATYARFKGSGAILYRVQSRIMVMICAMGLSITIQRIFSGNIVMGYNIGVAKNPTWTVSRQMNWTSLKYTLRADKAIDRPRIMRNSNTNRIGKYAKVIPGTTLNTA